MNSHAFLCDFVILYTLIHVYLSSYTFIHVYLRLFKTNQILQQSAPSLKKIPFRGSSVRNGQKTFAKPQGELLYRIYARS